MLNRLQEIIVELWKTGYSVQDIQLYIRKYMFLNMDIGYIQDVLANRVFDSDSKGSNKTIKKEKSLTLAKLRKIKKEIKNRCNSNQPKITKNDVNDILIDLYLMGKESKKENPRERPE